MSKDRKIVRAYNHKEMFFLYQYEDGDWGWKTTTGQVEKWIKQETGKKHLIPKEQLNELISFGVEVGMILEKLKEERKWR